MASLTDPAVRALLQAPHHAVVSTLNADGSIRSAVVWISLEGDELAVNGARGRNWSGNLDRDPTVTVVVYDQGNPYEYVEIRGTATGTTEDAHPHTDRLAQQYMGVDTYPGPDEERVKYVIDPKVIRYQKQG
jgi:PPOX class probable F420-dependent enzyme